MRRQLATLIHDEGNQLHRLVTNLLDATRLEAGVELNKTWVDCPRWWRRPWPSCAP